MTTCTCCAAKVWVMYGPAMCDDCKKSGCDPLGPGSVKAIWPGDFGDVTVVEKVNPCRREHEPWCLADADVIGPAGIEYILEHGGDPNQFPQPCTCREWHRE